MTNGILGYDRVFNKLRVEQTQLVKIRRTLSYHVGMPSTKASEKALPAV